MSKLLKKAFKGNVKLLVRIRYIFYKGFFTSLRGFLRCFFLGRFKLPLFIGKGVKIDFAEQLNLGRNVYIGDYCNFNCLSLEGVQLGSNVTIREFGWLQLSSSLDNLGEKIIIGDNTYVGPRVVLGAAGTLKIGSNCQIGANVNFIAENHSFKGDGRISEQGVNRQGINIGNDCWIGNNAIILDGVCLGNSCVVGAGSVITKSFPDNSVIVGNPAKLLKSRLENV